MASCSQDTGADRHRIRSVSTTTAMSLIDRIPLPVLITAAVLFGLAPFFPVPHLWEKLAMLVHGELTRPVDIFDLLVHGGPILLVAWRLKRDYGPQGEDMPDDTVDSP